MAKLKVRMTFTEPLLGTLAGDPKVATEFILSKNPEGTVTDEVESLPSDDPGEVLLVKASTVFPRDAAGRPFIWDYQIKGWFKEACLAWCQRDVMTKEQLKKLRLTEWMYKRTIDLQIFVRPRRLMLILPDGVVGVPGDLDFLERPLRKETFKGGKVCLARSEMVPVGSYIEATVTVFNDKLVEYVKSWLVEFGPLHGMLQWRNSGMGRFEADVA